MTLTDHAMLTIVSEPLERFLVAAGILSLFYWAALLVVMIYLVRAFR